MAKVLTCPACGAPLSLDDDGDDIVECFYCKRHVVVASGALTQAAARRVAGPPPQAPSGPARPVANTPPARKGGKQRAKQSMAALIAAGAVALVIGAAAFFTVLQKRETATVIQGDEVLAKLELATTHEALRELFAGRLHPNSTPTRVTVDFPPGSGVVRRAELGRPITDRQEISDVVLFFNAAFKKEEALTRLRELVPNRIAEQGAGVRVFMGDAVLDVSPHALKIWHWTSVHPANADTTNCMARLTAMWAVARAVALKGPTPTPAALKLVNGPTLEEASALDASVSVEQAAESVQSKFPAGWCRMQAGLLCVVDVDDALVEDVRWTWPNGLRARAQQLRVNLKKRKDTDKVTRALAGCLEPVLGKGEEEVVDYVRGTRSWSWAVGDSKDPVELGQGVLFLQGADSAPVDRSPAWSSKVPALFSAVRSCQLGLERRP